MNRPPPFPDVFEPGQPHWRRWWQALLVTWGLQLSVLWALFAPGQSWLEFWLWSAVLPLCWALALALRVLAWQIGLFQRDVHRRTVEAFTQRWWDRRSLGLPVQQVLLLGPAGDVQLHYQNMMAAVPAPLATKPEGATQPMLRCPVSLSATGARAPALARHLARLTLALPELSEHRSMLRAIAWLGDEGSQAAFVELLIKGGVAVANTRLPLQDLRDLDRLIDAFHVDCRDESDWLLCAGVMSVEQAGEAELPGEAGFLWLVSRQGRQVLHRGEYLSHEADKTAADLCAQIQRYAGLDAAPFASLALDQASQEAFVEGKWGAGEHQLSGHWGVLAHIAPFIGMSLALLQAGEAGQSCGWLSRDGDKRLAIGVATTHDKD